MEDAQQRANARPGEAPLTPEERQLRSKIHQLEMSRTRVLGELQRCCQARFRAQLESELAFLDSELCKLQPRPEAKTRHATG